jgi:hypothetical protein
VIFIKNVQKMVIMAKDLGTQFNDRLKNLKDLEKKKTNSPHSGFSPKAAVFQIQDASKPLSETLNTSNFPGLNITVPNHGDPHDKEASYNKLMTAASKSLNPELMERIISRTRETDPDPQTMSAALNANDVVNQAVIPRKYDNQAGVNSNQPTKLRLEIVKTAVEAGADINKVGPDNLNPIMRAAWSGNDRLLQGLIDIGKSNGLDLNKKNSQGQSAIRIAVLAGTLNPEIIKTVATAMDNSEESKRNKTGALKLLVNRDDFKNNQFFGKSTVREAAKELLIAGADTDGVGGTNLKALEKLKTEAEEEKARRNKRSEMQTVGENNGATFKIQQGDSEKTVNINYKAGEGVTAEQQNNKIVETVNGNGTVTSKLDKGGNWNVDVSQLQGQEYKGWSKNSDGGKVDFSVDGAGSVTIHSTTMGEEELKKAFTVQAGASINFDGKDLAGATRGSQDASQAQSGNTVNTNIKNTNEANNSATTDRTQGEQSTGYSVSAENTTPTKDNQLKDAITTTVKAANNNVTNLPSKPPVPQNSTGQPTSSADVNKNQDPLKEAAAALKNSGVTGGNKADSNTLNPSNAGIKPTNPTAASR